MQFLLILTFATAFMSEGQDRKAERRQEIPFEFTGMVTPRREHPGVGLVLSGGGARGLAQIGVIKSLEKHDIPIDIIVGNSMGGVVGGLYASGYTTSQIESLACSTDWDAVLSFTEATRRRDLFMGQKQFEQGGYLIVRFDGLQPIIPSSISSGQRLSDFFTTLTLQALYHPDPSFDALRIPYRAVSTDLLSGKRILFDKGSLGEALRASISVPLLYAPFEKDSMSLVDGGLTTNIPVDVADSLYDGVILVVNSTSGMRRQDQLTAPWEVADQIMTIMMQESNARQLSLADVVLTPEVGDRIVSDFTDIPSLVDAGEQAADRMIDSIRGLIVAKQAGEGRLEGRASVVEFEGTGVPEAVRDEISHRAAATGQTAQEIYEVLERDGTLRNITISVDSGATPNTLVVRTDPAPVIREVSWRGNVVVSSDSLAPLWNAMRGRPFCYRTVDDGLKSVLTFYRDRLYSLARIGAVRFDTTSGLLDVELNEGIISDIRFENNRHTKDYVVRRELPFSAGDVFRLDGMNQGLVNIASLGLFEYVLTDIRYEDDRPVIVMKVNEKSTELLRAGLHADNERGFIALVDLRDVNFRGAGEDIGLSLRYGLRDRSVKFEYRANRIFQTYLTFNLRGYFVSRDVFTYLFDDPNPVDLWKRVEEGQYRESRLGASFTFGTQLERLGNATAEIRAERQRIGSISGSGYTPEDYRLVSIKLQTTVDTEDRFAFPTEGVLLSLSYESAGKGLGSNVSFSKLNLMYESFFTIADRHTLGYRVTVGYADKTLPIAEQYSMGGINSFFGLLEDDSRGRQLFLVNAEYRYRLPFKIIFDTHLKGRYDLGMISAVPEDLKFREFRHGLGIELGLNTPLGPVMFGAGRSFFFRDDLSKPSISFGPVILYFSVGPPL
jgi:NTE family protein